MWLVSLLLAMGVVALLAIGVLTVFYLVAASQVESLTRQLIEARTRHETLERDLAQLRRDVEAARTALERSEANLAARGAELAAAHREVAALKAELELLRSREATGARDATSGGGSPPSPKP